ncbi:uncharacterized protein LOC119766509 [Culex quinquefasciatus]|uniref:uncharacterized protein LOC119766509 n=1 Tax=Culex quinquefasciatus TaxID=7176 RepID=UPI0018E3CE80|nr:uncharacterized protein LOC119766509 [Culex quinquefasciatus]
MPANVKKRYLEWTFTRSTKSLPFRFILPAIEPLRKLRSAEPSRLLNITRLYDNDERDSDSEKSATTGRIRRSPPGSRPGAVKSVRRKLRGSRGQITTVPIIFGKAGRTGGLRLTKRECCQQVVQSWGSADCRSAQVASPSALEWSQQHLYPGGSAADVTEYEKDLGKAGNHPYINEFTAATLPSLPTASIGTHVTGSNVPTATMALSRTQLHHGHRGHQTNRLIRIVTWATPTTLAIVVDLGQ